MEPWLVIAGVGVAVFLGGIVKGAIGFGMPLVSVPLMTALVDVRIALALATVPIFAMNLRQTFRGGMFLEVMRRLWWLLVALAAGFAAGGALLVRLDPELLLAVVGLVVIVFVITSVTNPELSLRKSLDRPVGILAGVTGGVLGALTTFFGPPMIMYLVAIRLPVDLHIAAIGAVWLFGGLLLIGTYASVQILTWHLALLSTACVVPAILGMMLGEWMRTRINQRLFRAATLFVLFLIGLSLLRHALPWF